MKLKNQEKVWDFIAINWNEYRQNPLQQVKDFLKNKKRKVKILDLGCGSGRNFINDKKFEFYGVDFSKEMLKLAKKKGYKKLVKAELYDLPFDDNYFDYALYIASLHCIPSAQLRENSLKELARVLKKGGKALISVWNKEHKKFKEMDKVAYLSWGCNYKNQENKIKRYYYLYDKDELVNLLKKYFKIIKIYDKFDYEHKSSRRFARMNLIVEVSKI